MDALDKGAGGILNHRAAGFQSLIDLPGYAVGADDYPCPRLHLGVVADLMDAHVRKAIHNMPVVDDRTVGHGGSPFMGSLLHHIYRTLHTGTEPGCLCQFYSHLPSPQS